MYLLCINYSSKKSNYFDQIVRRIVGIDTIFILSLVLYETKYYDTTIHSISDVSHNRTNYLRVFNTTTMHSCFYVMN